MSRCCFDQREEGGPDLNWFSPSPACRGAGFRPAVRILGTCTGRRLRRKWCRRKVWCRARPHPLFRFAAEKRPPGWLHPAGLYAPCLRLLLLVWVQDGSYSKASYWVSLVLSKFEAEPNATINVAGTVWT
jgi:hypothetical protein